MERRGRSGAGHPLAGIPQSLYQRLVTCAQNIALIDAALEIVEKLAEVLRESKAKYEDDREGYIGQIADAVKSAARRVDPSLLAPFEKTLAYNAEIALRSAATRRKNAEAAEEEQASEAPAPSAPAPNTPAPNAPAPNPPQ